MADHATKLSRPPDDHREATNLQPDDIALPELSHGGVLSPKSIGKAPRRLKARDLAGRGPKEKPPGIGLYRFRSSRAIPSRSVSDPAEDLYPRLGSEARMTGLEPATSGVTGEGFGDVASHCLVTSSNRKNAGLAAFMA